MAKKRKALKDLRLFRSLEERIAHHGVSYGTKCHVIHECNEFPIDPNVSKFFWKENSIYIEEERREETKRKFWYFFLEKELPIS